MKMTIEMPGQLPEMTALASMMDGVTMEAYMVEAIRLQLNADLYDAVSHGSGNPEIDKVLLDMFSRPGPEASA